MSADIGNLRIGQAPQGVRPLPAATPSVPRQATERMPIPPPVTPPTQVITVPSSGGGPLRKILFIALGALVLLIIVTVVIALLGRQPAEPAPSETPSPGASLTPTPANKPLRSYFGFPTASIDIKDETAAATDFENGLIGIQPTARLATGITVTSSGTALTSRGFMDLMFSDIPMEFRELLGTDWLVMAYGQTEVFDSAGSKSEAVPPIPKTVAVFEVVDSAKAVTALSAWEASGLASSAAQFLGYDTSNRIVSGFSSGTYRSVPIRYWNFPFADTSVDYAVVTTADGVSYVILSSSRESMFFSIDQLMQ